MISTHDNISTIQTLPFMGYEEIYHRTISLINMIQAADSDLMGKDDIYFTCNMIIDMLPSLEDYIALEKLHKEKL